jgi:hypothetical protein
MFSLEIEWIYRSINFANVCNRTTLFFFNLILSQEQWVLHVRFVLTRSTGVSLKKKFENANFVGLS